MRRKRGSEFVVEGTKHNDFKVASLWREPAWRLAVWLKEWMAISFGWLVSLAGPMVRWKGTAAIDASHFLGIVELDVRGHLHVAALVAQSERWLEAD